ncbi:MAG: prepilin-type N-terminal cleavage/methylation domain-containing protein [Planctomycetes bacterium]|nr:prepilin-type N-terminal cleavage/methylation domain-containing protein [Planctomycetota bacterium]
MVRHAGARWSVRTRRAFSLVELVIVVVIIGVLSAIAVPRMSGAASRSGLTAIRATLTTVRKAIDTYYAEHGMYPGYNPGTGLPSNAAFPKQLVKYSDAAGNVNAAPGLPYIYGPYLRKPFPTNPLNGLSTVYVKGTPATADPAEGSVGWVAVLSHGYFGISATDNDLGELGADTPASRQDFRGGASID